MVTLENRFACLANLPVMPVLLMDALQQLNGKQDLNALVEKISQDPSMVIRLLRIANSPFYGMSREIGSLREAIILLGVNRIRDMLISLCFSTVLVTSHNDFNFRQLWYDSVAVAECARQLAELSDNNPDFAFTAGLLHNIGVLLIAILFSDEFSLIISEGMQSLAETERRVLGFDHLEIGSKAAQQWNLPITIQEAIAQHQTPPQPNAQTSLGLLIYTANLLLNEADDTKKSSAEDQQAIHTALVFLNISHDQAKRCSQRGLEFAKQIMSLT